MKIEMSIVREENGQVSVSGPIGDKMLCYGLIECARDAIREYKPGKIEVPKNVPAALLKNQ